MPLTRYMPTLGGWPTNIADLFGDRGPASWRDRLPVLLAIFLFALVIRSLTGFFLASNLENPGWFPFLIYQTFHDQAVLILEGEKAFFWIDDASATDAAIYPPGYPLWLALIYGLSGIRSAYVVQVVQLVIDAASILLLVEIARRIFGWKCAVATGFLAGLSPLLAMYGSMPLADAPTSWFVLAGTLMLVRAADSKGLGWAIAAGAMLGASCWFRSNGLLLAPLWAAALFFCLRGVGLCRFASPAVLVAAALLTISPIVIRNSITFDAFVPTGLGAGTNLWEGIGETERAAEFGAVYGDRALLEQERREMGREGDETVSLYWPDGVQRDRARMRKAIEVIAEHPAWYATVVVRRMWGHLQYTGRDSPIYGHTGINVTPSRSLPSSLQYLPLSIPVMALGAAQLATRLAILPLMAFGIAIGFLRGPRSVWLIASTVVYYLFIGNLMHSEIRYSLPMQAVLYVFAGVGLVGAVVVLQRWIRGRYLTNKTVGTNA